MEKQDLLFKQLSFFNRIILSVLGLGFLACLYFISVYNYLLFHSLVEVFSVVVSFGIFAIGWNSRKFSKSSFLLFIGITVLFIGFVDFIHLLAYKGMGVFPDYDANLPTQLWIAARYLQAISFLAALIFVKRKFNFRLLFGVYLAITVILFLSIFSWGIFPDAFIEGQGLTPFKKVSEYIISAMLLLFTALLYKKREEFDKDIFGWLVVASIATIISEISFTFYVSVFGLSNMVGHILKVVAFYALYIAIIKVSLFKPYSVLFGDLQERSEKLKKASKKFEEEVAERRKIEEKLKKILEDNNKNII